MKKRERVRRGEAWSICVDRRLEQRSWWTDIYDGRRCDLGCWIWIEGRERRAMFLSLHDARRKLVELRAGPWRDMAKRARIVRVTFYEVRRG